MSDRPTSPDPLHRWSTADSQDTYGIDRWGRGYFGINKKGNVTVKRDDTGESIDMHALVEELQERGIQLPLLLRFSDILKSRITELNEAFHTAISDCEYQGRYRGVFPIKVNQARTVIEEIVEFGRPFHYGLEAGSKPELMAILALHRDRDSLIICNGYKDDEYIRMALLGSRLGATIVLVAEKASEIDRIHRVAKELGIAPSIGIRVKLSAPGFGKWQQSGGDHSKFGLSATEIVQAVEKMREWGTLDQLRLMHFHLGSQITSIRSIKNALREAARIYVGLKQLGCEGLDHVDVGGGLGVDYDGSQTNFHSSMNYSMQEYANDVVHELMNVCDQCEIDHPNIVSESGRAISAHHSVLVVDVLEVSRGADYEIPAKAPDIDDPIIDNFYDTYENVTRKNAIESYHDAGAYRDQALQLFNLGHLSIKNRVLCDQLYWATCRKIKNVTKNMSHLPEELEGLERALCDTYFLNFSLFQSLPDAWAVDQLFPIMPLHRHDREPSRRGVLADITCDSDGCVDQFIDLRDVKKVLELHPVEDDSPYLLGFFMVGAYQEILGDLHNLFGDTNTVHVSIEGEGSYHIEEVFGGDTMTDVLRYVNYSPEGLVAKLRKNIELAVRDKHLTLNESKALMRSYRQGLEGYTYLSNES